MEIMDIGNKKCAWPSTCKAEFDRGKNTGSGVLRNSLKVNTRNCQGRHVNPICYI